MSPRSASVVMLACNHGPAGRLKKNPKAAKTTARGISQIRQKVDFAPRSGIQPKVPAYTALGWYLKKMYDLGVIGPGKALDTERYFVICSNVIGGCKGSTGPASTSPATGKPYGAKFPVITIRDMVHAQKLLVDHLGITRLYAVVGGSMGGMQVLQWTVSYPDAVKKGLEILTENVRTLVRACKRAGVDGFYVSTQGGETFRKGADTFEKYIKPTDLAQIDSTWDSNIGQHLSAPFPLVTSAVSVVTRALCRSSVSTRWSALSTTRRTSMGARWSSSERENTLRSRTMLRTRVAPSCASFSARRQSSRSRARLAADGPAGARRRP